MEELQPFRFNPHTEGRTMKRTVIGKGGIKEHDVTPASVEQEIYQWARKENTIAQSQKIASDALADKEIFSFRFRKGDDLILFSVA